MRLLISMLLAFTGAFAAAEGRSFALTEYFTTEVRPGDVVCEVLNLETNEYRCFLTLDFEAVLTKGVINATRAKFKQVRVKQLLGELEAGALKSAAQVDVFLKLDWITSKASSNEHIVQGKILIDDHGKMRFSVTNVPDLMAMGAFLPSADFRQAFGVHATETEIKSWIERVVTSVLPAAGIMNERLE